jgi:hypothetical protein
MGGSEISSRSERFELSMSSMSPAFRKREEIDWSGVGVENLLTRERETWVGESTRTISGTLCTQRGETAAGSVCGLEIFEALSESFEGGSGRGQRQAAIGNWNGATSCQHIK